MALRRTLAKRLFRKSGEPITVATLENSPFPYPSVQRTAVSSSAAKSSFHREHLTSPEEYASNGFFRRFLQRRGINQAAKIPEFLSIPVGDKLRERLRSLNIAGDGLCLDGLNPPSTTMSTPQNSVDTISVPDARKILRIAKLEKLKSTLREIPMNSISYSKFLEICIENCSNRKLGLEFAKTLDEAGNVIVVGNTVYLRPDQVAKSMEKLIFESIAIPGDPRKEELEQMENQKARIDGEAESLVRRELYCGLGYLALQTLGFMRLTFWELSWDVMEPICFFVTSLHFGLAYGFFLRTSREPTFEGYFRRRFRAKQMKLMKTYNFDLQRYNELCSAFYPNGYRYNDVVSRAGRFSAPDHVGEMIYGATCH